MNYKFTIRILVILFLFTSTVSEVSAQVVQKIGSNSFTINPKAVFELESTTKGFLPPRLTVAQQNTMGTDLPEGLVVYITDGSLVGLQIWKKNKWTVFLGTTLASGQILIGNALNNATAVALSGDIKIDNSGITAVQGNTITSEKIVDATIAAIDIANNAITNDKITNGIDKSKVGLGNVDNTTDLLKPISSATQTALDAKATNTNLDLKAPLASPAFTGAVTGITAAMVNLGNVDNTTDLLKPISSATQTALDLKATNTNLDLKAPLASPAFTGTVTGITATMVGLNNVNNTTDLLKPISTTTQTALDLKASTANLDLKENAINKSIDFSLDKDSDVKFPSVKVVKTYVDAAASFDAISTILANYTAKRTDYTILCNNNTGAFQLTLPDPASVTGKVYVIRKTDESANILTISPALKLTESTFITSLDCPKTVRIQSDGISCYIID